MKKLLLPLIALLSLHSCKKDEDRHGICQLTRGYVDDLLYASSILYNNKGEIIKFKENENVFVIEYYDSLIEMYDNNGEPVYSYKLNPNGLIKTRMDFRFYYTTVFYEYNSEGFLICERSKYDSIVHFIENEDRVKSYYYRKIPAGIDTITYEYYPEIDPAWGAYAIKGKGKASRHLLKKVAIRPGVQIQEEHYTYLRNEYGYVTRVSVVTKPAGVPISDLIQRWTCK